MCSGTLIGRGSFEVATGERIRMWKRRRVNLVRPSFLINIPPYLRARGRDR